MYEIFKSQVLTAIEIRCCLYQIIIQVLFLYIEFHNGTTKIVINQSNENEMPNFIGFAKRSNILVIKTETEIISAW